MEEESQILASELGKERRHVSRLKREKAFLLDRILDYEDALTEQATGVLAEIEEDDEAYVVEHLRRGVGVTVPASTVNPETAKPDARVPPGKKLKKNEVSVEPKWTVRPSEEDEAQYLSQFHLSRKMDGSLEAGPCLAINNGQPCRSKALKSRKYCAHHIPLDPTSGTSFCKFVGDKKKCWMVVNRGGDPPGLCNMHRKREGLPPLPKLR